MAQHRPVVMKQLHAKGRWRPNGRLPRIAIDVRHRAVLLQLISQETAQGGFSGIHGAENIHRGGPAGL